MAMILGKEARVSLEDPEEMAEICHALSSPVRVKIMRLLAEKSKSVGEIAEEMDIPMSTAALAVQVLQKAGLIITKTQPGTRGTLKLCSRKLDKVSINLAPPDDTPRQSISFSMPIGGFSSAEGIQPTCGLASVNNLIGVMDLPSVFYMTSRFSAQLIWFQQGFLEYRFSIESLEYSAIEWLELSFEACSEAPKYRDPWKSDIAVEINHKRLGIWTSPCDCGGRRGLLTPEWWSETSTQFGFLKIWRVDHDGSYLDNQRISDLTLEDLQMESQDFIGVRIGVPEDAEYVGGLNLFGEQFGDYAQNLVLRIGYKLD